MAVCFSLQGNSAKNPKGFTPRVFKKPRGDPAGISLLGNDIQEWFQYEDETSDYIQSSEEVSQEQKGIGHILRNIYQHMIRFDERLANLEQAMVENKLTSPNHKMAQPAEMDQTPGDCAILIDLSYQTLAKYGGEFLKH